MAFSPTTAPVYVSIFKEIMTIAIIPLMMHLRELVLSQLECK